MIADPQGKAAAYCAIQQWIVQVFQCHAFCIGTEAEQGQDALCLRRKFQCFRADDGDDIIPSDQISCGTVVS